MLAARHMYRVLWHQLYQTIHWGLLLRCLAAMGIACGLTITFNKTSKKVTPQEA